MKFLRTKDFTNWNVGMLSYENYLTIAKSQRLFEMGFSTAERFISKLEDYEFISPRDENDKRIVLDKMKHLFIIEKYINGNINKINKDLLKSICRGYNFIDISQSQFLECVFKNKEEIIKRFNKEINNNQLWIYNKKSTWGYRYELDNNFKLDIYNQANEDISYQHNEQERHFILGGGKLYLIGIITQALLLKIMIEFWNKQSDIKLPPPTLLIDSGYIARTDFSIIENLKTIHGIESYTLTIEKSIEEVKGVVYE